MSLPILTVLVVGYWRRDISPIDITSNDLDSLTAEYGSSFDPVTLNAAIDLALARWGVVQWQLNGPVRPDRLNILIIDSSKGSPQAGAKQLDRIVHMMARNAVYIGHLRAVVVDRMLIEELAERYFPGLDQADWARRGYLVDWIVSHEVGHFIAGHASAHFEFEAFLGARRTLYDQRAAEIEADANLVRSIVVKDQTPLVKGYSYGEVYLGVLIEMLRRELERADLPRACGVLPSILGWIGVRTTHPEFVLRAYYLASRLADDRKDEETREVLDQLGEGLNTLCP